MEYLQILNRLYSLTHKGVTLGLERVQKAAEILKNPQNELCIVQIGGTNGKGTVSAVLANALKKTGYKTGLFTSPHLHRFSERIKINNEEVSKELLSKHLGRVLDLNDSHSDLSLSFFEVSLLAALTLFGEMKLDVAVLEVGLGGRLDATTITRPKLTAITSVDFDHMSLLGNTIEQIAYEKAGIIKYDTPVVIGPMEDAALNVIEKRATELRAPVYVINRDFAIPKLTLPWPCVHQQGNAAIAFQLFKLLGTKGLSLCSENTDIFIESLKTVFWPGRYEIIKTDRRYILDCAHNMQAATALDRTLCEQKETPKVLIFGALRDKPAQSMLSLFRQHVQHVVLMPPPIDRAIDPSEIATKEDAITENAAEALGAALRSSNEEDTILVTGSLFTVAKIREILLCESSDMPIGL